MKTSNFFITKSPYYFQISLKKITTDQQKLGHSTIFMVEMQRGWPHVADLILQPFYNRFQNVCTFIKYDKNFIENCCFYLIF